MIFVTVANHTQGFQRLIDWMDSLAAEADEEVVMQIGHTQRPPIHARWFRQAPLPEVVDLTRRARVVVAHAGAGTLLTTRSIGTPLVVVPRRAEFGEHLDDHQVELCRALQERGDIQVAETLDEVRRAVEAPPPTAHREAGHDLVDGLRARIAAIAAEVAA